MSALWAKPFATPQSCWILLQDTCSKLRGRWRWDLGQMSPFHLDIWFLIGGLVLGQHHEIGPYANVMVLVFGACKPRSQWGPVENAA